MLSSENGGFEVLGHAHEAEHQKSDGHEGQPDGDFVVAFSLMEGPHGCTLRGEPT